MMPDSNRRPEPTADESMTPRGWLRAALCNHFGDAEGQRLFTAACAHYDALLDGPSPFVDPREQAFAAAHILPVIALYRALLDDGHSVDGAQTEAQRLYAQHLRERRVSNVTLFRHLPFYRQIVHRWVRQEVEATFPTPTFKVEQVEDADAPLAYDVKRCPFLTATQAYDVNALLPVFCRLDEVRFDVLATVTTCDHIQFADSDICRFRFTLSPESKALEDAESYLAF